MMLTTINIESFFKSKKQKHELECVLVNISTICKEGEQITMKWCQVEDDVNKCHDNQSSICLSNSPIKTELHVI